jgi:uncharacterized membrane protein
MNFDWKLFLTILIILLAIDFVWIGYITKQAWADMIETIQKKPMSVRPDWAFLTYLIMTLGIYVLVLRTEDFSIYQKAFVLGLVMYGVFDGTNRAIFTDWNLSMSMMDVAWGTLLTVTTVYLTPIVRSFIKNNFKI